MGAQLGDDELNELPSKKMYANFHNNDAHCMDAYFYDHVDFPIKKELWNNNVTNEILKALCYIYNKNKRRDINIDDCYYLYHWLNYIIYPNIRFHLHSISVIKVIQFLLKSSDGQNICKYDEYNINIENYRDIKMLFDFSKDYNKLNEYFNKGHWNCNGDFRTYLNDHISKYNEFKDKCKKSHSEKETCIAFKKYFAGKENLDLHKWTCNSGENTDRLVSREGNHENLDEPSESEVVHKVKAKEKLQEETLRTGEEGGFTGSIFTNSNIDISHSELRSNIDNLNNSSSFTVSNAITIGTLVIGITVFSVLFYKFTPFGYWMKKFLLGKSKRKRNIIRDRNIIEDYTIPQDLGSPRRFNVT